MVPSGNLEQFKTGEITPLSDCSQKSDPCQNAMLDARNKLNPLLKIPQSGSCWCDNIQYFQETGHKGCVNLLPVCFQQGYDVSISVHKP